MGGRCIVLFGCFSFGFFRTRSVAFSPPAGFAGCTWGHGSDLRVAHKVGPFHLVERLSAFFFCSLDIEPVGFCPL